VNRFMGKLTDMATVLARMTLNDRISLPHLIAFLRYNSALKMANMIRLTIEMKVGRSKLKSSPFIMFLEVNNICNLHCPFCLTGKGKTAGRPRRNMSFSEMKQTIDEIGDYLYFIQLYNWGEPLLNKDLFDFIRYSHSRRIFTMVSSNMNFSRRTIAEQVVSSGLDYFIAAIDGFSGSSYTKYRRGGNFERAMSNLKEIQRIKKKIGTRLPFVEWQYVVFRHNQHEVQAARSFAKSIDIDYFHPIPGYIEDPEWITTLPEFKVDLGRPESVSKCGRPWSHFNVRADGGVAACCYEFFKKDDFGNIFERPLKEIWNNRMFLTARKILSKGLEKAPRTPKTICHKCVASGIRPSFEEVRENC
jgi:MoaA/NifB/PqqE/SkfB family radical SAM enzyme